METNKKTWLGFKTTAAQVIVSIFSWEKLHIEWRLPLKNASSHQLWLLNFLRCLAQLCSTATHFGSFDHVSAETPRHFARGAYRLPSYTVQTPNGLFEQAIWLPIYSVPVYCCTVQWGTINCSTNASHCHPMFHQDFQFTCFYTYITLTFFPENSHSLSGRRQSSYSKNKNAL